MTSDDDEAQDLEEEIDEHGEPASVKRVKRKPSATLQLLLADFTRRAKGLTGAALDRELDALVERMIESHAKVVPTALRDEYRERVRRMLLEDPSVAALMRGLRAASHRERSR